MIGKAERAWLTLLALTLAGAWLAETGHAGWPLTPVVATLIAVKGRLVIDRYMAITSATPRIRAVLHGFVTLVPLLVIFSHGGGAIIKRLTTLG